jgi:hypothetical protein
MVPNIPITRTLMVGASGAFRARRLGGDPGQVFPDPASS